MYKMANGKEEKDLNDALLRTPLLGITHCNGKQIENKEWLDLAKEHEYKRIILNKLLKNKEFDEKEIMREVAPGEKINEFNHEIYRRVLGDLTKEGLVEHTKTLRGGS